MEVSSRGANCKDTKWHPEPLAGPAMGEFLARKPAAWGPPRALGLT